MIISKTLSYKKLNGLGSGIEDFIAKANNLVSTATPIVEKVQGAVNTFNQSNSSSNPVASYQPVIISSPRNPNPVPQAKTGLSTGAIVDIVAGGLAVLGTVIYVATRPTGIHGLKKIHHKKSKKK